MSNGFKFIDASVAASLLKYDAATGDLIWLPRDGKKAFNSRHAGKVAGHVHTCTVGKTYLQVRVNGELHYAHRIAWVMVNGEIPPWGEIDHINGDGTDNRIENLRLVSSSGNKRNQRKLVTNTSGYTGVYRDKRRGGFYVRAWNGDAYVSLGRAETAEEGYAIRLKYNRENGFHENHGQDRAL